MARVLIVEDDEMDRIWLEAMLEKPGHELYFASNGDEARLLLAKQSIDVVVNLGARLALPKPADAQRLLAAVEEASSD